MQLQVDIGADEIRENMFQVIIYDTVSSEDVGVIYGKTSDEAFERANKIVNKFNQVE